MFNFSKALLPLVLIGLTACSTPPRSAGAQDLSVEFHSPAPEAAAETETTVTTPPPSPNRQAFFAPTGGSIPARVTRAITPEAPLRMMIVGDSLADGFGMFMKQRVANRVKVVHGSDARGVPRLEENGRRRGGGSRITQGESGSTQTRS